MDNQNIIIIKTEKQIIITGFELTFLEKIKILFWKKNHQLIFNNYKIIDSDK